MAFRGEAVLETGFRCHWPNEFLRWLIAAGLLCVLAPPNVYAKNATIIVKVPVNTPPGTVYLTGDNDALCNWKPQCVALNEVSSGVHQAILNLPDNLSALQFKVSRGSWTSEASDNRGKPISNLYMDLKQARPQFVHSVINWVDQPSLGVTGTVSRYQGFFSPQLNNHRDLIVWMPPSYQKDLNRRYPVVYMHDGQNIFDPFTSSTGVDWGVDEAMTRLIGKGEVKEAIVVGLNSTSDRMGEYDFMLRGKKYADFLVDTVKPFIDSNYRTLPERDHTSVMGSSMGALISVELVWTRSDIFSRAGAVSLPVRISDNALMRAIGNTSKPEHPIRIYMDHGDQGWDGGYFEGAETFYRFLQDHGFRANEDVVYRVFPYADHSEVDWARRVDIPLRFMLGGP